MTTEQELNIIELEDEQDGPPSNESPVGTGDGKLPTLWWELAAFGLLIATALGMRLWDLGSRALHHDESLHAFYSYGLSQGNGYVHTPLTHGPFQFEANAGIFILLGDSDFTSRLLYVLMGTLLVGLPFLFRRRLGRLGAIITASLLAFSPTLLYFSRFARNDILMAVWALGLVISMWRYIDEGKSRYMYISAAILALAFSTKETSFLLVFMIGLFLALLIITRNWPRLLKRTELGDVSPPVAAWRVALGMKATLDRGVRISDVARPTAFLLLLVTLTLPQWSAAISLFQDSALLSWSNLVLAMPEGTDTGLPIGGGLVIAFAVVITLVGLSIYWGAKWNWSVWWRSALIFYVIWVLLYTTFFTNINGIGTGLWQSLGYWVAQQDVARGNQPWYYYFVIGSVYEFLPLLFGVVAAVYFLRKRDAFTHFLVYWAVASFILYTIASEKMPWLLVNVTLPLIILTGKFLGDVISGVQWRHLASGGGMFLLPGVPLALFIAWRLAFFESGDNDVLDVFLPILFAVLLVGIAAGAVFLARRSGVRNFAAFSTVPVALILLVLTIRAGATATYQNGDTPVELLVYTQTSPDITQILRRIEQVSDETGQPVDSLPITIDQTSGFTWPWAWYLRGRPGINYPTFGNANLQQSPDASLVLVHSQNLSEVNDVLIGDFTEVGRVRQRWWFPESTYRGVTIGKFFSGLVDRQTWRDAMDYFLYRDGVRDRLGTEDAYLYVQRGLPLEYSAPAE